MKPHQNYNLSCCQKLEVPVTRHSDSIEAVFSCIIIKIVKQKVWGHILSQSRVKSPNLSQTILNRASSSPLTELKLPNFVLIRETMHLSETEIRARMTAVQRNRKDSILIQEGVGQFHHWRLFCSRIQQECFWYLSVLTIYSWQKTQC